MAIDPTNSGNCQWVLVQKELEWSPARSELRLEADDGVVASGLDNLGNTCYLNSTLQALFSIRAFFLRVQKRSEPKVVTQALKELFTEMAANTGNCKKELEALKLAIGHVKRDFSNKKQQDAMQFIEALFECLNGELNLIPLKNRIILQKTDLQCQGKSEEELSNLFFKNFRQNESTPLTDLFLSQTKSVSICQGATLRGVCGNRSVVFDHQFAQSVEVPSQGGLMVLKTRNIENLTGSDQVYCSACDRKCDVMQDVEVTVPPPILIVHLKRFRFDRSLQKTVKKDPLLKFQENPIFYGKEYAIKSVICHSGTPDTGHYVALCKDGNDWYSYNDRTRVKIEGSPPYENAYIVFYQQVQGLNDWDLVSE